jgi:hypothetical protein
MSAVTSPPAPLPRGLRLTFAVLTLAAAAVIVAAAARGTWFVVVIVALMAVANLYILWTTRPRRTTST